MAENIKTETDMNHLQEALDDITAARVALKAGYKTLAMDFLQDAQDKLNDGMGLPKLIALHPDVERCEAVEKEFSQI